MTVTKILKVGNGHYVEVKQAYLDRLGWARGTFVTVELDTRGLLIRPLKIAREEEGHGQAQD